MQIGQIEPSKRCIEPCSYQQIQILMNFVNFWWALYFVEKSKIPNIPDSPHRSRCNMVQHDNYSTCSKGLVEHVPLPHTSQERLRKIWHQFARDSTKSSIFETFWIKMTRNCLEISILETRNFYNSIRNVFIDIILQSQVNWTPRTESHQIFVPPQIGTHLGGVWQTLPSLINWRDITLI